MVNPIAVALVVILLRLAYKALKPPPPKICGSVGGPIVTSPRVKLSDGRHLAYREFGVPKEEARFKIIVIHGFHSSKDINLPVSQELVEDLGIYFLFFDRAGYGESDPHPSRSVKSEAYDIQELADKVQIGHKFYVIGMSLGAYAVWSCLKYIPHRLCGAALVVPFVSYWWPSFPANLSREALQMLPKSDQWTFRVAHYASWLFYWWMTQKWFPSLTFGNMLSSDDLEIIKSFPEGLNTGQVAIYMSFNISVAAMIVDAIGRNETMSENPTDSELTILHVALLWDMPGYPLGEKITQQGEHESLHRDIVAGFGKWEFGPTDILNPFPNKEGSVHIWQGYEDRIIPYTMNRFISQKLPWIHYHELSDGGHMFVFKKKQLESIIRELLLS